MKTGFVRKRCGAPWPEIECEIGNREAPGLSGISPVGSDEYDERDEYNGRPGLLMASDDSQCLAVGVTQVAALSADLETLVDRLESHCRTECTASGEFADEVRRLRLRAKRLLEPSA